MKRIDLTGFRGIESLKNEKKSFLKLKRSFGFTLAEIMIVLTVIGILTAVLIPIAFNSAPDENLMKFKKGHNILYTAIKDLVNSDQYYMNGDLGLKPDGLLIGEFWSAQEGSKDDKYFCQTFADVISTKSANCYIANTWDNGTCDLRNSCVFDTSNPSTIKVHITDEMLNSAKKQLDLRCKNSADDNNNNSTLPNLQKQILTTDDITFYETNPRSTFGFHKTINGEKIRRYNAAGKFPALYSDDGGFDAIYKIFCMDVDEINKDEDPFGYGIRADGKIMNGARAEEWLNKSLHKGN